MTKIVQHDTV